ncbi:MAG: SUMF1/EgtB/PvdO family nonheme iron enzyme [Candidatus Glassbacteria bacterium]
MKKITRSSTLLACAVVFLLLGDRLPAGSRLGKVTGVMDAVISTNLGNMHGVRQGLRGRVFKFDEQRKTVNVAMIQVIGVSDSSCLARVTELITDTVMVGQFVDIEGTISPRTLEKVDIIAELEDDARNYFAANQYTEPDTANCLDVCNELLAREPNNRLALALKRQMADNYFTWAERQWSEGNFTYTLVYYSRQMKIVPDDRRIFENLWELLDLIEVENEIELENIPAGKSPDYYYAIGEQYYLNGQYDKAKAYFNHILEFHVKDDPVAIRGIGDCDKMLVMLNDLRQIRAARAAKDAEERQKREREESDRREQLRLARYYRTVAEDMFQRKDYLGALTYYYKLLEHYPDDTLSLRRKQFISTVGMVLIPACEFSRGSNDREIGEVRVEFGGNDLLNRELPKNWVYLDSFYIDRYEVTNRQYKAFVQSTNHSPPLTWKNGTYPAGADDHPVTFVSWLDAESYARWIGKRLPTELEWEKAARGSNGFQWPWGDRFYAHRCNVLETGKGGTMPVGSFLSGVNEYGVLDLAGNVWEWVADDLRPYPDYNESLYYFPKSYRKVLRGGSFKTSGDFARGAFRGDGAVTQIYSDVGFRCASDATPRQENIETARMAPAAP